MRPDNATQPIHLPITPARASPGAPPDDGNDASADGPPSPGAPRDQGPPPARHSASQQQPATRPDDHEVRPRTPNSRELQAMQAMIDRVRLAATRERPLPDRQSADPRQLQDSGQPTDPFETLVSLHYVRAAARRSRRRIGLCIAAGALLAVAFLVAAPNPEVASTSVVLRHAADGDPWRGMLTDVSLTQTRVIAEQTVQALGLTLTPEQLQGTLVVPTPASEVLTMTMSGPSAREAVRRLAKFTDLYLAFRARTLSIQTEVTIQGFQQQIKALQVLRSQVQAKIDVFGSATVKVVPGQDSLNDLITRRAQIDGQIDSLQGQVQDAALKKDSVVRASLVIDPAAPVPRHATTRLVLALASGLIGGLALGFGLVVLQALLSDKLRMREEFAAALGGPVRCSVRSVRPPRGLQKWCRFLPWVTARQTGRATDLANAARTIQQSLPAAAGSRRLIVACIDGSDEARFAVAAAAIGLRADDGPIQLVDLSEAGRLDAAVDQLAVAGPERPSVLRPSIAPALAVPPTEPDGQRPPAVQLILAEVSLDIGMDYLRAWADDLVVAVTSGRSGVQRIRATRDLIESAGLGFRGSLLFGTDAMDSSSGI